METNKLNQITREGNESNLQRAIEICQEITGDKSSNPKDTAETMFHYMKQYGENHSPQIDFTYSLNPLGQIRMTYVRENDLPGNFPTNYALLVYGESVLTKDFGTPKAEETRERDNNICQKINEKWSQEGFPLRWGQ